MKEEKVNLINFLSVFYTIVEDYRKEMIGDDDSLKMTNREWIREITEYIDIDNNPSENKNNEIKLYYNRKNNGVQFTCSENSTEDEVKSFIRKVFSEKDIMKIIINAAIGTSMKNQTYIVNSIRDIVEHDSVIRPSEVIINGAK